MIQSEQDRTRLCHQLMVIHWLRRYLTNDTLKNTCQVFMVNNVLLQNHRVIRGAQVTPLLEYLTVRATGPFLF